MSGDIEACKGIGFSEFVLHDYTGDVHKWQTSLSAFGPWTDLSETSDKLKIENNGETRYYRVNVISGVCASDNSNAILHTVYEPTMAGQIIGGGDVCAGGNEGVLELTGYRGEVLDWGKHR